VSENRPFLGIVFFITANFLTASVNAIAKYLSMEIHPLLVTWGYFVGMTVFVIGYAVTKRMRPGAMFTTQRLGLQLLRALLLVLNLWTLFVGLTYMPLADAVAIVFAAPLIITALSGPLLGERIGPHRWGAVLVGLGGILFIVQPSSGMLGWVVVLPLASAVAFSLFQIVTRKMAGTESTVVTLFYSCAGATVLSTPVALYFWSPLDARQLATLLFAGALGAVAHFFTIRAFALAQASFLAPFNYVRLLWAIGLGYIVFSDIPGPYVLFGSAIVIACGLYVMMRERRLAGLMSELPPDD
jgi:drug/metabolite transporter (DMT)-like permease